KQWGDGYTGALLLNKLLTDLLLTAPKAVFWDETSILGGLEPLPPDWWMTARFPRVHLVFKESSISLSSGQNLLNLLNLLRRVLWTEMLD
ncbi:hypothetical protein INR49_018924, partial [Caranx melampygus]